MNGFNSNNNGGLRMNGFNHKENGCINRYGNVTIPAEMFFRMVKGLEDNKRELRRINRRLRTVEEPMPVNTMWQIGNSYPPARYDQYPVVSAMPVPADPVCPTAQCHCCGGAPVYQQQTGNPQNANLKMLGLVAVVGVGALLGGLFLADKLNDRS